MGFHLNRKTLWNTVGARVLGLVSRKGGVGKTTSAVNIGAALALSGHAVLVVGTDPQCGVCRTLGCPPKFLPGCLNDIFNTDFSLVDVIQPSTLKGLSYVSPKILSLQEEEKFLDQMEHRADKFVQEIDQVRDLFDTILIDCPPSLGPCTKAALQASDSYLVPVQAEELCRESLESLLDFVETFRLRHDYNSETAQSLHNTRPLFIEGLFLTMANTRTIIGKHVASKVAEEYPGLLFETMIPRNTRLSEMSLQGKPTVIFDRRSSGSRAYFNLADEITERFMLAQEKALAETSTREVEKITQPPAMESVPQEPEIVSLKDLLANEERFPTKTDEGWDDGYRPYSSGDNDPVN